MVTVAEGAKKCGPLKSIHCQLKRKRPTMHRVMTKQCADILKKLMNHEAGWVFNQPVDPVALNIPDYFDVISKPMDLGTIRSKLEKDLYADAQEFVADVRLTFSNAMRYNPSANPVHIMAKELNNMFSMRWNALELKWKGESAEILRKPVAEKPPKRCQNAKQVSHKLILSKRVMSAAEKQKLRKDLAALLNQNMPTPLLKFLQRFRSASQIKERIEVDIDVFDEKTAWELHGIVKGCLEARSASSIVVKRGEHGSVRSLKILKSGSAGDVQTSSNDINGGNLPMKDRTTCQDGVLNLDRLACNTSSTTASAPEGISRHAFDDNAGDKKVIEEESAQPSYLPATPDSAGKEGSKDLIYDEQLSPSKALRAAMLKSRFADTILKAQNKTLLSHGEKADPVKMHEERIKLERRQQEEKARIEAQVRAAEAAARMRAETEMKRQREREREAARLALQKMEKTVEIDENREILKDLEMFGYFNSNDLDALLTSPGSSSGSTGFQGNPLEQLGLFIKDDYMEEDEDDPNTEVEEGEIGS